MDLEGIEHSADPALLRQKSRDFYWYSPVLKRQLDGKTADLWARPRDEAEVLRILTECRAARVPVTARGGATGNYGQCVPLEGGLVLDMTAMDRPLVLEDGVLEAEAGAKMIDMKIMPHLPDDDMHVNFESPADPATVRAWYAAELGGKGFVLKAEGNGLIGTDAAGKPFGIKLQPAPGGHSRGTISKG